MAVLTLAIGIGVNTAVFSLVYAALLRPLPYPAAERLVWIAPYDDHFRQDNDVDRTQPVYEFRPLEQSLAESIAPRRLNTLLLGTFAASALILALAGTFGVVARTVARRTREIGVRIALGARPPDVVLMIVRRAMIPALGGIAVGVPAAIAIGRTMRGLLYGVEPDDWTTIAVVAGGLALSALAASWLPARRAAGVDPMIALRDE